jgi:hypothetical protein
MRILWPTLRLFWRNSKLFNSIMCRSLVYCVRNVMAHGDAREGKWRGNWRMKWVASTLTRRRNVVYPALLTLMRTPRLPAVHWTDAPADLNGLVRFAERRNLVSARVQSHFNWPLINNVTFYCVYTARDSSVGTATRYGLHESNPGGGKISRTRTDLPWGPPSLLDNGYWVFPGGKAAGGVAFTTHPI